jgi:hypothetical protein
MKKLLATLAIAGLAGGFAAGIATADELTTPAGTLHYGADNGGYIVAEGNGTTPNGYIGVEGDGPVAACNGPDESYSAGNGEALDPASAGSGDTSCLEP